MVKIDDGQGQRCNAGWEWDDQDCDLDEIDYNPCAYYASIYSDENGFETF